MRRLASTLALALSAPLLLGCPPAKTGKTDEPDKTAKTDEGGKTGKQASADPLEGSVFSQDELFAIYAAYQDPDLDARNAVLRKHRLVDAQGQEQAVRVKAFDQALETYASRDPEGWAEFVESLGR